MAEASPKKRSVDLIICFLLGYVGIHKFYEGKIGMGILYLCTFGLAGVGWLIDLVKIATGGALDKWGRPITNW